MSAETLNRLKQCLVKTYYVSYYGPLRCAPLFRLERFFSVVAPSSPILSKRHRFIYYPIPKVACTTIKSLILEAEGHHLPDDEEAVHRPELFPEVDLKSPQFEGYFRFVFVRNPWSRLVSCYHNKVVAQRPVKFSSFAGRYPGVRFESMSFSDFVRFVCRVPDDLCEPHFKPQADFFSAEEVDFVGRFERFSEDLIQVIERVGLDESLHKYCKMQRMKSDSDKGYTSFYNAETQRLVAEKYKSDVERFDYRFGK